MFNKKQIKRLEALEELAKVLVLKDGIIDKRLLQLEEEVLNYEKPSKILSEDYPLLFIIRQINAIEKYLKIKPVWKSIDDPNFKYPKPNQVRVCDMIKDKKQKETKKKKHSKQ